MSEQTEQPQLTSEQIVAWQRQQAASEQRERQRLIADLRALAAERGYDILAAPVFTADGRLGADWGVARRGG